MRITLSLINGKIYTMDGRVCEAVAISRDKIVFVGSTKEIKQFLNYDTKIIDLDGKAVLPGFIDTHAHLVGFGTSLNSIVLGNAKSVDDIIECCRDFIKKNDIKPGEWILGRGWNQNNFTTHKVFPNKEDLDKISTRNPILLLRVCGHIGVANTMALKEVGITKYTYIEGGSFDRYENGELNGVIREAALEWFKKNRSQKSGIQDIKKAIVNGANELLKHGITSIHSEDSYDLGYSGDFFDIYNAYRELSKGGKLKTRVYQKISLPRKQDIMDFLDKGLRTGDGDDFYKIGPVKQWCDGTIGARTAALIEDYSDDPGNRGILVYNKDELYENVLIAHKEGMQFCIHAIGDAALEMVLDAYEKVLSEYPKDARHRIVHCQVGNRALYERIAKLNLIVNIQPPQIASDWPMMKSRLGESREKESHNYRTLSDLGVCLTGGSDIPVESPNVFYGIYAAVTRKDADGKPEGGWLPEQKTTVEEVIKMYTINAAYSAFEEKIKGTITEGKLADMIVLSHDPFEVSKEDLKDIKVEKVILGGTCFDI